MKYFLSALLSLVLITPAQANEPVAKLTDSVGDISILRHNGSQTTALNFNDDLFVGDIILTDDEEYAEVTFIDESTLTLAGMGGRLVIEDFNYGDDVAPAEQRFELTVLKSSFEYTSGLIESVAPKRLINIDFGSIGIRGTHLFRSMEDKECWIYLQEGEIDVYNEAGKVGLLSDNGTRLAGLDTPPTAPSPWAKDKIEWIKGAVERP